MAVYSTRNRASTLLRLLALIPAALSLAGCLKVHMANGKDLVMTEAEFSKYVERVFRYHNQVMNELIESGEDPEALDSEEARRLAAAEAKMVEVCNPLNEVVSESLSGEKVGLKTEMALVDAVPACEAATHTVEDLMP